MVGMAARPPTHKGPTERRASRRPPMATRRAGVHLDVRGLSSHAGTGFVVQLPSLVVSIELSSMTLAVRGEVVQLDRTVFVLSLIHI